LQHIKQLVEYITGMDTRIGYPNEHLAGNSSEEISSPLYATAVGLVMNSIENKTQSAVRIDQVQAPEMPVYKAPVMETSSTTPEEVLTDETIVEEPKGKSTGAQIRENFFEKYVAKIKDFLDNAE
jgi:cell division protein FtsA